MTTDTEPAGATGFLTIDLTKMGRFGPIRRPTGRFLVTDSTGRSQPVDASESAKAINVAAGSVKIELAGIWPYPYRRSFSIDGQPASRIGRAIVGIDEPVTADVVMSENPRQRLAVAAVILLVAAGFLVWVPGSAKLAVPSTTGGGALFFSAAILLFGGLAFAAVTVDAVERLESKTASQLQRPQTTLAADLGFIVAYLLLIAFATSLIGLGLFHAGQLEIRASGPGVPYESDVVHSVLWHLVDAIPAVDAPKAWGWADPVRFSGRLSWLYGALLFACRAAVAITLVGLAARSWKRIQQLGNGNEGSVAPATPEPTAHGT